MITVTETAASQMVKLLARQQAGATGVRVGVKAGGCSGFE
jgi:Fe-S cluster assembly iron-binding protein IscA